MTDNLKKSLAKHEVRLMLRDLMGIVHRTKTGQVTHKISEIEVFVESLVDGTWEPKPYEKPVVTKQTSILDD